MWNEPSIDELSAIPELHETKEIPFKNKLIYLHFSIFDCDWYIAEYEKDNTFLAFVNFIGGSRKGEWMYVNFNDLKDISLAGKEVESDISWKPCKASKIDNIRNAQDW